MPGTILRNRPVISKVLKIDEDVERKGITFLLGPGCPCRQLRPIQAVRPWVFVLSTPRDSTVTFWTACAIRHATGEGFEEIEKRKGGQAGRTARPFPDAPPNINRTGLAGTDDFQLLSATNAAAAFVFETLSGRGP